MSTNWDDIKNDPNMKFDESKLDLSFLQNLVFGLTEEELDAIHQKIKDAMDAVEKKQAILDIFSTVASVGTGVLQAIASMYGVPLPTPPPK